MCRHVVSVVEVDEVLLVALVLRAAMLLAIVVVRLLVLIPWCWISS